MAQAELLPTHAPSLLPPCPLILPRGSALAQLLRQESGGCSALSSCRPTVLRSVGMASPPPGISPRHPHPSTSPSALTLAWAPPLQDACSTWLSFQLLSTDSRAGFYNATQTDPSLLRTLWCLPFALGIKLAHSPLPPASATWPLPANLQVSKALGCCSEENRRRSSTLWS